MEPDKLVPPKNISPLVDPPPPPPTAVSLDSEDARSSQIPPPDPDPTKQTETPVQFPPLPASSEAPLLEGSEFPSTFTESSTSKNLKPPGFTPLVSEAPSTMSVALSDHTLAQEVEEDTSNLTKEELKEKREHDRIIRVNESKKEFIRNKLEALKVKFKTVMDKNEEIQEEFRLPRSNFALDQRIAEFRHARIVREVEAVYQKFEWEGSRSVIACEKIHKFFLDTIETHHQKVTDLEHKIEVHNFRHRILTPEFWEAVRKNKGRLVTEELQHQAELQKSEIELTQEQSRVIRLCAEDLIGDYSGKTFGVKTKHAIRHLEERLSKKYTRECEITELNASKVPDDYEELEDAEALRHGIETIGDYRLKQSENYFYESATVSDCCKRITELKIQIYESIKDFNQLVKALEDEKISVIGACRKLEQQIVERQKYLPPDQRLPIPVVYDVDYKESPDSLFKISDEAIYQRQKQNLEAAGLLERKLKAHGETAAGSDLLGKATAFSTEGTTLKPRVTRKEGDFLRNWRNDPLSQEVVKKELQGSSPTPNLPEITTKTGKQKSMDGLSSAMFKYRKAFFHPKTEAAQKRRERILARRSFERDYFLNQLKHLIKYFKGRVAHIRDERIQLQLDIKLMSIGLLVLLQEMDIIKICDQAEINIQERFRTVKMEYERAKERVEKANRRLTDAIETQTHTEKSLLKLTRVVVALVNRVPKFSEFLFQVYEENVQEHADADAEEEEDKEEKEEDKEEEEEGEEEEDIYEEQEVSREKKFSGSSHASSMRSSLTVGSLGGNMPRFNTTVCPEGVDPAVFKKVCGFRLRRVGLESEIETMKSNVERLGAEYDEVRPIFDKFSGRLDGTDEEVSSLHKRKQKLINDLKKVVILKADQIRCLDNDKMELEGDITIERLKSNFPNLDEVIVFPKDGVAQIDSKVEELKDDILRERKKQERARHMVVRLTEELHKKENVLKNLTEQCRKDMVARFGRVVDLDEICASVINLDMLEAMEKLEKQRKENYSRRDSLHDKIRKTRHQLAQVTTVNSEFNTMLTILEERRRDVEHFLVQQEKIDEADAGIKEDGVAYESTANMASTKNRGAVEELYALEDRFINQEGRIAYLRETIAMCKLKTGVPPVTVLTCVPDEIGSKFMTFKELQDYKSLVNKEVEMLFLKQNATDHLLQSNSKMPSSFMTSAIKQIRKRTLSGPGQQIGQEVHEEVVPMEQSDAVDQNEETENEEPEYSSKISEEAEKLTDEPIAETEETLQDEGLDAIEGEVGDDLDKEATTNDFIAAEKEYEAAIASAIETDEEETIDVNAIAKEDDDEREQD